MFTIAIKSGKSGHFDYDGCDLILAEIPSNNIPNKGDILTFGDDQNRSEQAYLVTEVSRSYNHKNDKQAFGEYIYVYVILT